MAEATMESASCLCQAQHTAWFMQEKKEVLGGASPQDRVTAEKTRSGSSDANPTLSRTATQDHQTLSLRASAALRAKLITGRGTEQKGAIPIEAEPTISYSTLSQSRVAVFKPNACQRALGTSTQHE